jgi:hypothetical protein
MAPPEIGTYRAEKRTVQRNVPCRETHRAEKCTVQRNAPCRETHRAEKRKWFRVKELPYTMLKVITSCPKLISFLWCKSSTVPGTKLAPFSELLWGVVFTPCWVIFSGLDLSCFLSRDDKP